MPNQWTSRDWPNAGKAYIVARLERAEKELEALRANYVAALKLIEDFGTILHASPEQIEAMEDSDDEPTE
jgi:exonuclease VII small subunit